MGSNPIPSCQKKDFFMYFVIEDHLKEIKIRGIYFLLSFLSTFIALYLSSNELISLITKPLQRGLIFTSITESFFSQIHLSLFFAFLFTLPFLIYQIWSFLKPGLYQYEVSFFSFLLKMSLFLYLLGYVIAYYVLLPFAVHFLVGENPGTSLVAIEYYPKMSRYFEFLSMLLISSILLFQVPSLLLGLYQMGWVQSSSFLRYRKYFVLLAFVLGALFSPPDILSQLFLALPLIALYELTLFLILYNELKFKKLIATN